MLSIIGGQAKIIDMRQKSCIYVGLRKFKDTVRIEEFCYGGAITTLHVKRMNCYEKLWLMFTLALSKVAAVL
jgi:hypothetical protein